MVYYIESRRTDPYRNLALEQFVFDRLDREHSYFMLWQNHNSIIVGKHQNTLEEINSAFVKEKGITVARRLSGGGAVYHDLGNLNFTFITDANKERSIDFSAFSEPIQKALCSFGVPVEISGRNDMTVEGKKFSGNAQYIKQGRVMHHGTILYDSDLSVLSLALKPGDDKIESKGIKSVRSRVTNIRPYMKTSPSVTEFWAAFKDRICAAFDMRDFTLTPEHNAGVEELREAVYSRWSWNYGNSPPHNMRRACRIEGCGKIEILLNIEQGGKIKGVSFYGDFFGNRDPAELAALLAGHHLEYNEIKTLLADTDVSQYFHALDRDGFLSLLF
ncbi:MAG: lipoate--protein ligase [Treponema sp.]|nr:lipoate--protein ligase [Treponema sp.]